jgi:hypothetical protein
MVCESAFHGSRVFTTELTEDTEGQRRKASFVVLKKLLPPHPLCVLCALCCETVFRRFSTLQTHVKLAPVRRIEREEQPSHVTAWTRTPPVSSESAARASAETAERQSVVPICGACQPVVRGLFSRHREIDIYASAYRCISTAPGAQPPFRQRWSATAGQACGEYTHVMTPDALVTPCVRPERATGLFLPPPLFRRPHDFVLQRQ